MDSLQRAALDAATCPHAKAWLRALGGESTTHLGPTDVRVGLRTRLGLRVLRQDTACGCVCARGSADFHARTCALYATRLKAHNGIATALGAVLTAFGAVVRVDPPTGGATARRLDVSAQFGSISVGIDVTTGDAEAAAATALRGTRGAVAHARVGDKLAKHAAFVRPGSQVLLVWALDSFGAHAASHTAGTETRAALSILVAQCAAASQIPAALVRRELITRASVAYVRGLAARYAAHAQGSDCQVVPSDGLSTRLWRVSLGGAL
jgi:hypothetical protein